MKDKLNLSKLSDKKFTIVSSKKALKDISPYEYRQQRSIFK